MSARGWWLPKGEPTADGSPTTSACFGPRCPMTACGFGDGSESLWAASQRPHSCHTRTRSGLAARWRPSNECGLGFVQGRDELRVPYPQRTRIWQGDAADSWVSPARCEFGKERSGGATKERSGGAPEAVRRGSRRPPGLPRRPARPRLPPGLSPDPHQWRKWRRPVKTIARWWRSAISIAISSRIEPPGWMIAVTPATAAA